MGERYGFLVVILVGAAIVLAILAILLNLVAVGAEGLYSKEAKRVRKKLHKDASFDKLYYHILSIEPYKKVKGLSKVCFRVQTPGTNHYVTYDGIMNVVIPKGYNDGPYMEIMRNFPSKKYENQRHVLAYRNLVISEQGYKVASGK